MEEVSQILEKAKKKRWGKEEWIILILIGIFLLIVLWPNAEKEKQDSGAVAAVNRTEQSKPNEENNSYKEQMESQLENVLKSIDGIDSVNVMLTLQTSEEEVVLYERKNTKEKTNEEDNLGGTREIEVIEEEETVCYGEQEGESTGPYVTYTISPKVEGVLIVVGGDKASLLRTQIVRAVQALFDVESHKVVVIKMKES